jgi:hypothetical protein
MFWLRVARYRAFVEQRSGIVRDPTQDIHPLEDECLAAISFFSG